MAPPSKSRANHTFQVVELWVAPSHRLALPLHGLEDARRREAVAEPSRDAVRIAAKRTPV
jgi:hypothetical protein